MKKYKIGRDIKRLLALCTGISTIFISGQLFATEQLSIKGLKGKNSLVDQKKHNNFDDINIEKIAKQIDFKFSAAASFEAGYRIPNKDEIDTKISAYREGWAFSNQVGVLFEMFNKYKGIKYGANIALIPTGKRSGGEKFNGSHIFVEGVLGRIELGAPFDAGNTMFLDGAAEISAGAMGGWEKYASIPEEMSLLNSAETYIGSNFKSSLNNSNAAEPSRKISYYTPSISLGQLGDLKVGASYIPDSSNTGAGSASSASSPKKMIIFDKDKVIAKTRSAGDVSRNDFESFLTTQDSKNKFFGEEIKKIQGGFFIEKAIKDGFSSGISLTKNFAEDVTLCLASTYEYGKSCSKITKYDLQDSGQFKSESFNLKDLKTFSIGGTFSVKGISLGGTYFNLFDSLSNEALYNKFDDNQGFNGGVSFSRGAIKVSVNGIKSTSFGNKSQAVSFGADYKFLPGLTFYTQFTIHEGEASNSFKNLSKSSSEKIKNKVFFIGTKISL